MRDAEETKRRVFQSVWRVEEASFLRHFIYCWCLRNWPNRGAGRKAVIGPLYMLRLKRALNVAPPEELARYGIVGDLLDEKDTLEGWVASVTGFERMYMRFPKWTKEQEHEDQGSRQRSEGES
jgi:hypothetical protein